MKLEDEPKEETQFESLFAAGDSFRDAAGLKERDTAVLAHVAAVAFRAQRYAVAARIFAGLEAIEPRDAIHSLNRAFAEAKNGRMDEALAALDRFSEAETRVGDQQMCEALLLRAHLLHEIDPERASACVAAARRLVLQNDAVGDEDQG